MSPWDTRQETEEDATRFGVVSSFPPVLLLGSWWRKKKLSTGIKQARIIRHLLHSSVLQVWTAQSSRDDLRDRRNWLLPLAHRIESEFTAALPEEEEPADADVQ